MTENHQPATETLLARNADYATTFKYADLPVAPGLRLAVVACMDARLDPLDILGLDNGDAHVIRNAGGVVTDDVIRSLCLSQRALGTREIILLHHTGCGVQGLDEARLRSDLMAEVGVAPSWSVESFADPMADVIQSIRRLQLSPFVPHTEHVRGFVYNVDDGTLAEAHPPA